MKRIIPLLLIFFNLNAISEPIDIDEIYSEENFRWGVIAFHNGYYNNAILSFEKSLSLMPDNTIARTWLGRAFYKSGFEELALHEWQSLSEEGAASAVLKYWIELLSYRDSISEELDEDERYIVAYEIDATNPDYYQFRRPISIYPLKDGSFYLVAFGSNEILAIDVNSAVFDVKRGTLFEGFDHPYDIVQVDDEYLFISEYLGNCITKYDLNGNRILTFGEKGIGDGQLLGPQFIAVDGNGYIYVCDYGNRRINKYDYMGNFILSFGKKSDYFEGFVEPTGLAIRGEQVFVADKYNKSIYVFDLSGNFLFTLAKGLLNSPEGICFFNDNQLLIVDTTQILILDTAYDTIKPIGDISPYTDKLTSVCVDANNNILTTDFNQNKVFALTEMKNMFTGLFVEVERINASFFPEVYIDVNVRNRSGEPIYGLKQINFGITEDSYSVANTSMILNNTDQTDLCIALLVEKSMEAQSNIVQIELAIEEIYKLFGSATKIIIVSAGEEVQTENMENQSRLNLINLSTKGPYSDFWSFDMGVRKAASELIPLYGRKAIIFLSQGDIGYSPYSSYSLMELKNYLVNNSIGFHTIYFNQLKLHEDIQYLSTVTGSRLQYFYQPEGIMKLKEDIFSTPYAMYTLKYTSRTNPDFGRKYIPVEVEVTVQKRMGRDESGYYSPMEY